MSILIKNATIITVNKKHEVLKNADILIEKNRIKKIGQNIFAKNAKIIDAKNKIVLPGFVNAHTHAAMTLFRGFADDLPLKTWLEEHIWPAEAKLAFDDVYHGTMLACVEMIKAGITTFNDMYWFPEAILKAADLAGLRASVSGVVVGFKESWENDLEIGEKLAKKFKNNDRLKIFLGPHAVYSCDENVLKKVIAVAKKLNLPIHIHLAETKDEIKKQVHLLEKIGLFHHPVIAAHGVYIERSEMKILAKRKVSVAHCPTSNLKLASGRADIESLMKNGVNVCLGTDGAASNNRLDMFSEMKLASIMSKEKTNNPTALPAEKALQMATINGARALGLEKEIGSIEVGKIADLILIDTRAPHLQPIYNPVSTIVYAAMASDVSETIVDGEILMQNHKLKNLNEKKIIEKCQEISKKFR